MTDEELSTLLRDPFAELMLKRGVFPQTLRELLSAFDAVAVEDGGLPEQKCFLVAEGGQIPWTEQTAGVKRGLRFAVVRGRGSEVPVMVSASTLPDSAEQFLQLIGWDGANGVFHFYERRAGTWFWAGNSNHALGSETRGQGPFDSHVNGSMVMKELRAPWNNWHSMNAVIRDDVLAPGDSLRDEPLFKSRISAHELETFVVRPGVERWNRARFAAATSADPQRLADVPLFLRQVLETTTVNLVSSSQESGQITDDDQLVLPTSFFLNAEALLDFVGLEPDISPVSVEGRLYNDRLRHYGFALSDGKSFRQPGDTFFAFLVPEPAFEDNSVLALLLQEKVVSPRFAACLLMVDFQNPIFSARRAALMQYVPESARLGAATGGQPRSDIEAQFVAAVEARQGLAQESPEQEFLANWRLPEGEWKKTFESRIEDYFARLAERAVADEGFDGWMRLAESRRREFRRRPLAEFRLTIPVTNIPADAPTLRMNADGNVGAAPEPEGGGAAADASPAIHVQDNAEGEKSTMLLSKFDPPGFLKDFNAAQAEAWSQFISEQFDEAQHGNPEQLEFDGPREQFYNPTKVETGDDRQVVDITWVAFPRNVTVSTVGDVQRWRRADASRDLQDEYCEWSVERDPDSNKIKRVTFTCEGPEYWSFLANTTPDVALALYKEFVSPEVEREDLFFANGSYNPRNKWNASTVDGAMHLIQVNNSLGAEIELAAGSSVVRKINGTILTGEQELIRCGKYGGEKRHSDPHIGALVNSLTRQKADVTLENPIGLYFAGLNTNGWETPDGADPAGFWKYVRGTDEKPVRAVFEVPDGHDYLVGDIKIGGRRIDFAAQITDFINMKLTGVGTRFNQSTVEPMTGCRRRRPTPEADFSESAELPSVREFLSLGAPGTR
jgi:hypothetical protein